MTMTSILVMVFMRLHGQIIERSLLLGSGLGQHGDGDYYNGADDGDAH